MGKKLKLKTTVIAITILACLYGIFGIPRSLEDLRRNVRENIKLGLDLRGGSHLILQVQVQDAIKAEATQVVERLKEELRKANIDYAAIDRNDPATVEEADSIQIDVKGVDAAKTAAFRKLVDEQFSAWILTPVSSSDYRMNLRPTELMAIKENTVRSAIETIDNRINALGLTEPVVQQHGRAAEEYEILVMLPGVDDPARVKNIMQTAAVLELYEVKDGPFASQEQARAKHGGVLPINTKLVRSAPSRESGESWFLLSRIPVVTGNDLRSARPGQDEFNKWQVNFTLKNDAAARFGRYTEANIGNRLAIVLDNQVKIAPTIQNKIEGDGSITNLSGEQEAADLALVLRAGALPAGIAPREERSVGPALGADSIQQGLYAGLAGLAAVVVAMLIYYRKAGVNAVFALLLNTIVLMAALSYFDAVLTLPGIAGIILTIGMAVDSNVLIFERIREELKAGKAVVSAVDTGFNKAFWTIVDTHVTTIVSCAFLFLFGTGPVRGFAVTLVIGLVANVFTAVFVSRVIFEYGLSRKRQPTTLSI